MTGKDDPRIPIQVGDTHFDLAAVGDWIAVHWLLTTVIIFVGLLFWVLRPSGFGSEVLRFLTARDELASKRVERSADLARRLESRPREEQLKLDINERERDTERRRDL